jgi:hypothetical protein
VSLDKVEGYLRDASSAAEAHPARAGGEAAKQRSRPGMWVLIQTLMWTVSAVDYAHHAWDSQRLGGIRSRP